MGRTHPGDERTELTMEREIIERNYDIAENSIENYSERFFKNLDVSEKSFETYKKALKNFFLWLFDNGINQPKREDIKAYKDSLSTEKKSASTIQLYITSVKMFFRFLDSEGLYEDVTRYVKNVSVDRTEHKRDSLSEKQAQELLASIPLFNEKGLRDYAIIRLMLTTGLRTIEVANTQIGDIKENSCGYVLYIQGKGHKEKDRFVKLMGKTFEAIRVYLERRATKEKLSPEAPLFVSESNRGRTGITSKSVSRICKEAMRKIGLDSDRLSAHSFRHTSATLNMLNGGTLEETQQLLRHSSINTTMIYLHDLDRMKNNSEGRLDSLL